MWGLRGTVAATMMIIITMSSWICGIILFGLIVGTAFGQQDLLSCQVDSSDYYYPCTSGIQQPDGCTTLAVLRSNSYYSSLYNLSSNLGISPLSLSQANGLPSGTDFLPNHRPLLVPIDCRCDFIDGFFEAELTATAIEGDSFYGIAQSLEGLTSCRAIQDKNPSISPWNVSDKQLLLVPLKCACPSSVEFAQRTNLLLPYPVSEGDTLQNLASRFNTTPVKIISANNRSGSTFLFNKSSETLVPFSTILIPAETKPNLLLDSVANPRELEPRISIAGPSKMWMTGVYIGIGTFAFVAIIAIGAAFLLLQRKRKQQLGSCNLENGGDLEVKQLSLSVRTTSEKKVSFEGSSDDSLDGQTMEATTPHKKWVETFTLEELRRATESFSSANLIEDSVFHGRLNGKNLAIKRSSAETISKVDFVLFYDTVHRHPKIVRLLGTSEGGGGAADNDDNSYLIFEYAKNGSLKDWLHGGLAMKSQFIDSCYCFLSWNQRLKICLDVATALQFMHQVMNPAYVHRNIKCRNIFLDEEFNAKVGNFGMAKCVGDRAEEAAARSKGYLAPEYVERGVIAPSIDIFAYGVVVLEILSRQTAVTRADEKGEDCVRLSEEIKLILKSPDELREWIDSALGENYSFDAAVALANLARACLDDDPSLRPNAGELVDKLSRLVEELQGGDECAVCESSSKLLVKGGSK